MESAFYCLLRNPTAEACAQVELNLGGDKPLLEEDVQPQWQALYCALEFVVEPQCLQRIDERTLQVGWEVEFDSSPVSELFSACTATGCQVLSPLLWLESGEVFAITAVIEDGWRPGDLVPVMKGGEERLFDDASLLAWMLRPEG
jgi:hypothetical protein